MCISILPIIQENRIQPICLVQQLLVSSLPYDTCMLKSKDTQLLARVPRGSYKQLLLRDVAEALTDIGKCVLTYAEGHFKVIVRRRDTLLQIELGHIDAARDLAL